MEMLDVITTLIGNLGFSIFIAIFMLVKTSKEIKALTDAINMLSFKINNIAGDKK